ncbi:GNAT family N-acetyltransferase [Gemmatimonas sp.]|jgi:GNAT superfamily N-acetyltransferase|uniref:GNAT family N-acetyltransferase n=1 Tax=Gemmatimonas sp. TaxID=1962908 RepID=UPI0037C0A7AD
MALAERTIAEALRILTPRGVVEGERHATLPAGEALGANELLAMVDEQTITGEPQTNAVLVYGPAPMVLETLRFDVSPEEWRPFAPSPARALPADRLRVGALRGGVLVALATAGAPIGRLSHLRVLVSPAFRQIGLGHLVLHRAVQALLRDGLLPYATLVSTDLGARALARAVGFVNVSRAFGGLAPAY